MNPRRALRWIAVPFVAFVALASCSGDGTDAGQREPGSSGTEFGPVTTAPLVLERSAADVAVPVSFVAGDVTVEVTEVELSTASPGTYFDDDPELMSDPLLYVSFTVHVAADEAEAGYVWPVMSFQLVTATERTIAASGVDYAATVEAIAGEPNPATVVFPASADDLVGARFRLDDGVNPPGEVALVPPAAATEPAPADATEVAADG